LKYFNFFYIFKIKIGSNMKKCKKCELDFIPSKGLINFCSLSCRNSRDWDEVDKEKKRISAKLSNKVKEAGINLSLRLKDDSDLIKKWKNNALKKNKEANEKILNEEYKNLSFERLRKRIILEQNGRCNNLECGIDSWLGKKISLELEHKDGNNLNNSRENLECLCPNCHSITETWRGRNKSKKKNKVTDEELVYKIIEHNFNIRQALIDIGLTPKGGNYKRCNRLIKEIKN